MKKLTAFIFLFLLIVSCDKDSSTSRVCELSRTNMLGTYKLSKAYRVNSNGTETDVTGGTCYKACELDDTYEFRSDSLIIRDNAIRCSGRYGSTTWNLSGTTLYVHPDWNTITRDNNGPNGGEALITSFSCDSFVVVLNADGCPNVSTGTKYRTIYKRI